MRCSVGGEERRVIRLYYYSQRKEVVAQSCQTLCDPMDCSLPGSSVHGILQQEYWSGLSFPSSGDLPNPRTEPGSPKLQVDSLLSEPAEKPCCYRDGYRDGGQ